MNFFPDFATDSRKEWRVSLFQSNLRKQIRKLPKILKWSVKIIHYYSLFFICVLRVDTMRPWSLATSTRSSSPAPRSRTSSRPHRRRQKGMYEFPSRFLTILSWKCFQKASSAVMNVGVSSVSQVNIGFVFLVYWFITTYSFWRTRVEILWHNTRVDNFCTKLHEISDNQLLKFWRTGVWGRKIDQNSF